MNDRDRDAADDWMRDHMPSEDEFSLEDNDERGCEERFYFLRSRDSSMVVYRIRVKGGCVVSVKQEVFIDEDVFEGNPQEERWIVRPEGEKEPSQGSSRRPSLKGPSRPRRWRPSSPPRLQCRRRSGGAVLPRRASPSNVS